MKKVVVFAYSNVGVRCLKVLLAAQKQSGFEISLIVTHHDNPWEKIWFDSVAEVAHDYQIPAVFPEQAELAEIEKQLDTIQPDFIFAFYYRYMLPTSLLEKARQGAYNMHGSLLPKFRGRAPTNWAVLKGATETGATLHEMVAKPDAGAIIAQTAVPILPDDTGEDAFNKMCVAAEQTLWQALPAVIAGNAPRLPNDLANGSYFGGRKPEDGRIDWEQPAQEIYNLIRAVAPPYPGAFFDVTTNGKSERFMIARARYRDEAQFQTDTLTTLLGKKPDLGVHVIGQQFFGVTADGVIHIHELRHNGQPVSTEQYFNLIA
ncbi:formyltransferase [Ampullimonas aquatilis]|uniref:formyltransferase n=1 Tax=Ampullimonas aquatilis TaxID=1341549 RepID=UPI003C7171A4